MATVEALDSSQITKIGVGTIIGLVVVGFLLSMIITAVVARIVIAVVVVALAVVVWQQRTTIENNVKKCKLDMTFFGVTVHAPQHVVDNCKKTVSR